MIPIADTCDHSDSQLWEDELLEFFKQGKINPVLYKSFKMYDFVSAFNLFKERKVMGKVTLEIKKEFW